MSKTFEDSESLQKFFSGKNSVEQSHVQGKKKKNQDMELKENITSSKLLSF